MSSHPRASLPDGEIDLEDESTLDQGEDRERVHRRARVAATPQGEAVLVSERLAGIDERLADISNDQAHSGKLLQSIEIHVGQMAEFARQENQRRGEEHRAKMEQLSAMAVVEKERAEVEKEKELSAIRLAEEREKRRSENLVWVRTHVGVPAMAALTSAGTLGAVIAWVLGWFGGAP